MIKESGSSGEEEITTVIAEHREDCEYVYHGADAISTSTQTDWKTIYVDISTQTGNYDNEATVEDPVEEDSLNNSIVVIAEDFAEETVEEMAFDNRTAEIPTEELVIMENDAYLVFRAERVEITDSFELNQTKNLEEERVDETEIEYNELNPNESNVEGEIVAEESNLEDSTPLDMYSSLPKVVADCVETVFAHVSEFSYFVKPSEPSVEEVITQEARHSQSADEVLIETAEPESNAVPPETGEAGSVPSPDEEPVMEKISELVCEDPKNQDMPVSSFVSEILGQVESTNKEVIVDDASECLNMMEGPSDEPISTEEPPQDTLNSDGTLVVEDVQEKHEGLIIDGSPSKNLISTEEFHEDVSNSPKDVLAVEDIPGKSEDLIIGESISDELISTEEHPDGTLNSLDDAPAVEDTQGKSEELSPPDILNFRDHGAKPERNPEVIPRANVAPETVIEAELSPAIAKDDCVETLDAAIEALSAQLSATTPPEPEVESDILLEEEVITAATFQPLSEEQETNLTIPEGPSETVGSVEILSNELEAVPADERPDAPQTDSTGESQPCVLVLEESIQGNADPADVLLEDADKDTTVDEPTGADPLTSEEPEEESPILPQPQIQVVIVKAGDDEATEEIICETKNCVDVLAAANENSEDSQTAPSDELMTKYVEVVLETIAEEIITEDERSLVTSEEKPLEVIVQGEAEEKAENELSENSMNSTQSAERIQDTTATPTDMDALLVRLQSACTSVFEDSAYRLVGLKVSSEGYTITVTIHVASKEE